MLLLATQALPQMREYAHPNLGRLLTPRHVSRIADTLAEGWPVACDNDCFNALSIRPRSQSCSRNSSRSPRCSPAGTRHTHSCGSCQPSGSPRTGRCSSDPGFSRRPMSSRRSPRTSCGSPCPTSSTAHAAPRHPAARSNSGRAAPRSATRRRRWSGSCSGKAGSRTCRSRSCCRTAASNPAWSPGTQAFTQSLWAARTSSSSDQQPPGSSARRADRGLYAHMGRVNSEKRIQYAKSIGCTSIDGTGWTMWRRANLPHGLHAVAHARERPVHWQTRLQI